MRQMPRFSLVSVAWLALALNFVIGLKWITYLDYIVSSPMGSLGRGSLTPSSLDQKAQVCLVDPAICRLNHQHKGEVGAPTQVGGARRGGLRESTPLPPLPPLHSQSLHNNTSSSHHSHHQLSRNHSQEQQQSVTLSVSPLTTYNIVSLFPTFNDIGTANKNK